MTQLYVRKHKDEPLAHFTLERYDRTKLAMVIEPRALLAGQHALLVDGQPSRLLAYAMLHARHLIILRRS